MNSNGSNGSDPVGQAVEVLVYAPIGLALMAWKTLPKLVGDVVSRGCAQIGEAEVRLVDKVNQARMIGQMAVAYGGHQVRREVDSRLADARRRADVLAGRSLRPDVAKQAPRTARPPATPARPAESPAPPPPYAESPAAPRRPASTAAPPPYAESPAAPPPAATQASAARTVPAAAEAPAAEPAPRPRAQDLPIPEYDGLSASQVVQRLSGLLPGELAAVRAYEMSGRARKTVLAAIDRLTP